MNKVLSPASSDAVLYAFLARGSEAEQQEALSILYDRHASPLWHYCRRIVRDDDIASDIAQECFVVLYQVSKENKNIEKPLNYLFTVARNRCFSHLRCTSTYETVLQGGDFPHSTEPSPDNLSDIIGNVIEMLPAEYREVISLRIYGDLSYTEISEMLSLPLTTVRNRIARSKAQLSQLLEPIKHELEAYL